MSQVAETPVLDVPAPAPVAQAPALAELPPATGDAPTFNFGQACAADPEACTCLQPAPPEETVSLTACDGSAATA